MPIWLWIILAFLFVYIGFVILLYAVGKNQDARAIAGFIPDCLVLFKRLLADPSVGRANKLFVGLLIVYLAFPLDLVPDFIPVAGQLDDAILVALVLRHLLKTSGEETIIKHWPGPPKSLNIILRLVGNRF